MPEASAPSGELDAALKRHYLLGVTCPKGYILVVEDDADTREALRDYIEGLGCNVVTAADGLDGLARLEGKLPPCLVLLDMGMPRLDGEGFASLVRQRFDEQPIVSMSAEPRSLRASMQADGYLDKPFHPSELIAAMAPHCRTGEVRANAEPADEGAHRTFGAKSAG